MIGKKIFLSALPISFFICFVFAVYLSQKAEKR